MSSLFMLTVGASLAFPLSSINAGERQQPLKNAVRLATATPIPNQGIDQTSASLPVGRWNVEFANQITEVCDIDRDGIASVVEPVRISGGKAGQQLRCAMLRGTAEEWRQVSCARL